VIVRGRIVGGLAWVCAAVLMLGDALAAAPAWNQGDNVKAAAKQLADIQQRQGAEGAVRFISACYKTHGLASQYSKAYEGCVAQDYMQARALALVYARVDDATLKQKGIPTAEAVTRSLNARLNAAFAKYQIRPEDGQSFVRLVETQGVPVYLSLVFPKSAGDVTPTQPSNKKQ
jgi:hypothetical protein